MNKAKSATCAHAEVIMRRLVVVAISLFAMTATSRATPRDVAVSGADRPLGAVMPLAPGGSAILHGTPSPFGYVLVHIVSGAILARAWNAGVGNYRAGKTWVEPAFAYDIHPAIKVSAGR